MIVFVQAKFAAKVEFDAIDAVECVGGLVEDLTMWRWLTRYF
jgi:hypothetical protein